MNIPSFEELYALDKQICETFVSRLRQIYGESDEYEQWVDAFDLSNKHPGNKELGAYASAMLDQLIRTKHPNFISSNSK